MKHARRPLGIAGVVKMLIRKIEYEESNYGGHCNSHDRIGTANNLTSY
jgi:hypothetical protein